MESGKITRRMGRQTLKRLARNAAMRPARDAAGAAEERVVVEAEPVEPPNPYEVRIPCHLRSAIEPDIDAIVLI